MTIEVDDILKSPLAVALQRYVYVASVDRIADRYTGALITRAVANATWTDIADAGMQGVKSSFHLFMNAGAEIADCISYRPGKGTIVEEGSGAARKRIYNTWRPGLVARGPFEVTDADVAPWLEHVTLILPDSVARALFLDFCAFVLQRPGGKVLWCFTIIGEHGIGKDLMVKPIRLLLGERNFRSIGVQHIEKWTWWAESQIVLLEELPPYHKRDVYEKMKPYIAGQGTIVVDIKGVPHYEIPNFTNWIAFSNHDNALALPESDRRFFVYHSPAINRDAAYYKEVAEAFEDEALLAKIKSWLLDRDISQFNPGARPPMTAAKQAMIAAARDPVERYVRGLFGDEGKFEKRELITVKEIIADARFNAVSDGRIDKKTADGLTAERVSSVLRKIGVSRIDRRLRTSIDGGQGIYVWAVRRPELYARLAADSVAELRARFEQDGRQEAEMTEGADAEIIDFNDGKAEAESPL